MTEPDAHFGRFQLLGVLGRGGFATVYQAHDPSLDRDVALKTLLPHLALDPQLARRFLNEARAIARVHHPNIVTIFEAGEADGRPYYTMELIVGQTLAEELQTTGQLSLDRALAILAPLAIALDHLHAQGLVHRDVKPANVMLGRDGRVLLMDFGIARVLEDTRFTQSGASLGTPAYMAPEQVLDQDVDPPADIYALGIVAYQLLAGRPPFTGATVQVLHAQAYEPPPPLDDLCPGLPERVYAAISAALTKDPTRRPGSATLLVQQLAGTVPTAAAEPTAEMPAAQTAIEETLKNQTPAAGASATGAPISQPEPLVSIDDTLPDITQPAPAAGQEEVRPEEVLPEPPTREDEAQPEIVHPELAVSQIETGPEAVPATPMVNQIEASPVQPTPVAPPAAKQRPSTRRPRVLLLSLGLAVLLVLIGAGAIWAANRGGNGGSPAANNGNYQQVATDNHYSLTRFAARVGQPLTVVLRNNGQHQHNLHILNITDASGNEARTVFLQGGQSATLTVTFNAKGTWAFRCDMYPTEMNGSVNVD